MSRLSMSRLPRIFVSIASYRDVECQATVKDIFEKAMIPDRVVLGLCLQVVPGEDDDCFLYQTRPKQCRIVRFHARDSRGVCWARHQTQTLWDGEDYYLQIDSHMRFVAGWDEKLLEMLNSCPGDKPILTTYPTGYTPPNLADEHFFTVMHPAAFDAQGVLSFGSKLIPIDEAPPRPVPNPFLAAGLLFAPAAAIAEVPYDPNLYFLGEEITLAVRLFTHGWNSFTPVRPLIHHNYSHRSRRHWNDNPGWKDLNARSMRRIRHLLGMEACADASIVADLDLYGLGTVRSLAAYERFAGVNFRGRTVEQRQFGPPWTEHNQPVAPRADAAPTAAAFR